MFDYCTLTVPLRIIAPSLALIQLQEYVSVSLLFEKHCLKSLNDSMHGVSENPNSLLELCLPGIGESILRDDDDGVAVGRSDGDTPSSLLLFASEEGYLDGMMRLMNRKEGMLAGDDGSMEK